MMETFASESIKPCKANEAANATPELAAPDRIGQMLKIIVKTALDFFAPILSMKALKKTLPMIMPVGTPSSMRPNS